MAFAAPLNREQLIAWLGRDFGPSVQEVSNQQIAALGRRDALLVWDKKPDATTIDSPPPVIAIPAEDRREFFSFITTYVSTYQPFSAFFRVVPVDFFAEVLEKVRDRPSRVLPSRLVGAVIAEARAQAGERADSPSELSVQACLATLSSSAMAALSAGLTGEQLPVIFDSWLKTRRRIAEEALRLPFDRICEFWYLVSYLHNGLTLRELPSDGPARQIVQFVSEVISSPAEADPETWLLLTDALPEARAVLSRMRASREDRVRALDRVTSEVLSTETVDHRVREVVFGYLASRVGGASLRYLQLLRPLESKLPVAPMWFGLFSSFREDGDVLTAGECLGRRLVRHVANAPSLYDQPNADISAEELEILLPEPRSDLKFRTEHQGSLVVEIFPTITAVFRPPREPRKELDSRALEMDLEELREASYLLERLSRVINRLRYSQQSLFPERRPRGRAGQRFRKSDKSED